MTSKELISAGVVNATIYLQSYSIDELSVILIESGYVVDRCNSPISKVLEKGQKGISFFHLMHGMDAKYRAGEGFPFLLGRGRGDRRCKESERIRVGVLS